MATELFSAYSWGIGAMRRLLSYNLPACPGSGASLKLARDMAVDAHLSLRLCHEMSANVHERPGELLEEFPSES